MSLKNIKQVLSTIMFVVLVLASGPVQAEDTTESYSVVDGSIGESGPLYSSLDDIFAAYHNKLIYSLFGADNFKSFISVQTSPEVLVELSEMTSSGDSVVNTYLDPFSTSITSVISIMVIAFYSIAVLYIFFINGKFYFEKIYTGQSTHFKKSVNSFKSVGGNHFLRAITSIIVVTPVLPILINIIKGEDIESVESTPFTNLIFRALGTSFEYTERIAELFVGDSSVYEPYYQVPVPDALESEFQKINTFTACVVSKKNVGKIVLKSQVSELLEGRPDFVNTLMYEILLGECKLNITVSVDNEMLSALADDEIQSLTSTNSTDMMARVKTAFKDELDKYVVQSISVAKYISDIYFSASNPTEKYDSNVRLEFDSKWIDACDQYLETGLNGGFVESLVAYKSLPKCWSGLYIRKFAYPTTIEPSSLDETPSTRFARVCNQVDLGDHDVESMGKDVLSSCAQDVCKEREGEVLGIFQCSVAISNIRKLDSIKESTKGGFLFSPAYTYLQYSTDITDSSKNIINTLRVDASELDNEPTDEGDLFVNNVSGEEIYSYEQDEDRTDKLSSLKFVLLVEQGGRDEQYTFLTDETAEPYSLVMYYLNRFNTCQSLKNSYSAVYGPCGTTYQELNRLLDGYVSLFTEAFAIYAGKMIMGVAKDKVSSFGHGGLSSSFGDGVIGSLKSALRYIVGGGLAAIVGYALITDNPVDTFFTAIGKPDAFNPYASIAMEAEVAQLIMPVLFVFATPNSILSGLFMFFGFLWLAVVTLLRYLPAVVFLIAISLSILNLIAFAVTSPFQIANAFSDTGSEAPRKIKQLIIKLILVLVRFPLVVTGFFLAFEMLESVLPVFFSGLEWVTLDLDADGLDVSGSILVVLTTFFFYSFMSLTIFVVSLDCISALHKMTRGFVVSGSGEQVDGASKDIMSTAMKFTK